MVTCRNCGAGLSVTPCPFCGSHDVVAAAHAPTQVFPSPAEPLAGADQPTEVIGAFDPPTQVMPAQPGTPTAPPRPTTPGPPAWQAPAGTPGASTTGPTPAQGPAAAPNRPSRLPWVVLLVVLALIAAVGGAFASGVFDPKTPPPVATPAPVPATPTPSATPTPTPTPTATPTADSPTTAAVAPAPSPEPAVSTVYVPAPQPGPTQTVVVAPPKPDTPDFYPTVHVPAGRECSRSGNGPFSAAGTANATTSCAFADNVRDVYVEQLNGADGTIRVYSPTTKQTYDMRCSGSQPVLCVGGKAGRVVLYGGELTVG